jgi:hypothetical protein
VEGYEGGEEFDHGLLLKDLKRMCSKKDRPLGEVAKELSEKYGLPRKFVYQEGLKLKK